VKDVEILDDMDSESKVNSIFKTPRGKENETEESKNGKSTDQTH
jgi:hypothetical protein